MIKKNKLGLAVASAVLMTSVMAPSAFAAETAPVKRQMSDTSAPADSGQTRLIIKYKAGTLAATNVQDKLASVRSAAGRADVKQSLATGGKVSVPLGATHVRRLALGADAVRLSRKLTAAETSKLLAEIRADASVQYVQVDRMMRAIDDVSAPASMTAAITASAMSARVTPNLVPTDPFYATYQWHFFNPNGGINAPAAWDISTGADVVVAVLDTGILAAHPDMGSGTHILAGYDFITDAFVSRRATDDRVPGAADLGDWNPVAGECGAGSPVRNSSWHGTHVAGTMAELTNNGVGGAGVAYDAQVLPVRVLGRCGGYTSDIADAIAWASGASIAGVPDNANPAEVINLSLGGSGACEAYEQDAINAAVANGSTVVIAAGNSNGDSANFSPGNCNNVIDVGATRITGGRASYSNYGSLVDLSGPGGGGSADTGNGGWDGYVLQAGYNGTTTPTSGAYTYSGFAGTSMASPHVAAVAALVQSALIANDKEPLTPAAMEALLKETARPFPVTIPASTPIGTGIVDAKAALDKALEEPCDPEVEVCGPVAIELANKTNVTGLSGAAGSEKLYSFEATAGSVLSIMTLGGSGNVSLYVSFDEEPTTTTFDFKSARPGNSETVRINTPTAGTYYIKVVGAGAYSGVTLVARQ
ncbi:MAG TPA: S8 family peptidase [Pseudoxanthomonas sp.]|nr:S8 family peptidase [Pseudoxanthomonas sp.]